MVCADCDNCAMDSKRVVYQVHVTVEPDSSFLDGCQKLGFKGVHVKNVVGDVLIDDMMTSTVVNTLQEARETMLQQAKALTDNYFIVKRRKIETVPWNFEASVCKEGQYFETHINMGKDDDVFQKFVNNKDFMVSRNQNGSIYLTVRTNKNRGDHYATLLDKMGTLDVPYVKMITEFAIFDDNEKHDEIWVKN